MKKEYYFNYDNYEAECTFIVDTDKFTSEHAKATLEFFTWKYNKKADPIDEVLKKYAIEAIKISSKYNYNTYGVIHEFEDHEGFCKIDGSMGITLTAINSFEFEDDQLEMKISNL